MALDRAGKTESPPSPGRSVKRAGFGGDALAVLPQVAAAGLLLAFLACSSAEAHERSYSYSLWKLHAGKAEVTLRLAAIDVARLAFPGSRSGRDKILSAYFADVLRLHSATGPCSVAAKPRRLGITRGLENWTWSLDCSPGGAEFMESRLLREVARRHIHFARVERDGGEVLEGVLSRDGSIWPIGGGRRTEAGTGAMETLAEYFKLGGEHIAGGYDHLAFLLALLLLGQTLVGMAAVVTGFTIGHSVTLALAVSGGVAVETAAVEAVIGLSIAVVAAENLWQMGDRRSPRAGLALALVLALLAVVSFSRSLGATPPGALLGLSLFVACYFGLLARSSRPQALRWWVALVFGLGHGFGFAGAMMETGFARSGMIWSLAGFNLGVEAGQLAVAAILWPSLRFIARRPGASRAVAEWGSTAVLALGVFWFLTRNFG